MPDSEDGAKKPTLIGVIQSVLAAAIGVQSDEKRILVQADQELM